MATRSAPAAHEYAADDRELQRMLQEHSATSVRDILFNEVSPVVEQILLKHIKEDIYGVYTPQRGAWVGGTTYQRRKVLEKPESMVSMITPDPDGGVTLLVTSDAVAGQSVVKGHHFAQRQPGAFLQLLESGHMGIWKKGFARPAVANAQAEVDSSSEIQRIINQGLERMMND